MYYRRSIRHSLDHKFRLYKNDLICSRDMLWDLLQIGIDRERAYNIVNGYRSELGLPPMCHYEDYELVNRLHKELFTGSCLNVGGGVDRSKSNEKK